MPNNTHGQIVYIVESFDRDHNAHICGVFATHEETKSVVQKILAVGEEAFVLEWRVGGRRLALWTYDEDNKEGCYYIYPITENEEA